MRLSVEFNRCKIILSNGDLSLPLGLALGSPIFPWSCEGKLGVQIKWIKQIKNSYVVTD